ncbi:serine/threonine protein kinase [Ramlibacter sp. USB13]|uniref:non-specific serine/threonine protein kinase n=1 Tax=Ramlibacter cellulosilyticus TaxID=2764187 RepID=A0A923MX06_9BURK|nr:serine/threonine protein kinase [Ramlibacter cellulosilyticus]
MNTPPVTHFGRYRVVRELGRGAMGVVYLAEDASLQRQVAVKTLLLPEEENSAERRNLEARFIQEAKAAGGLNHPGIITIHDLGREGDWLYIAMELLEGTELKDRMQAGPMPIDEALDIAAQVASALSVAHARGVVHRDVKPGNIMLLAERHAKIMDFGIARMKSSDVRTQSGTMMGSPKYMSPEQVGGHPVDHRSDIFSLGVLLYEMLSGQPAFSAENLGALLNAIMRSPPTALTELRPEVPGSVDLVIARAMQKNPNERYQDAAEMARDLTQCRAVASRSRPVASAAPSSSDPYASTLAADSTQLIERPPEGLGLSPLFDSTAGLQRLLRNEAEPVPQKQPRVRYGWLGWAAAYLLAGMGAIAIAFG